MKSARIFLERVSFGRYLNMHMAAQNASSEFFVAQPVTFTLTSDSAAEHQPMMQFIPEQAQQLMDELWTVGYRPTQGQQSEGQMGATTRHLNDMRAMVANLAKVDLP